MLTFICLSGQNSNAQPQLYLGADLSYINEIEDCGGNYYANGQKVDPFILFKECGANIVRVRLWHTPTWTSYSTYSDVEKTIGRAKRAGMKVLLDFHYSDDWADPQKQIIPAAWASITDETILQDSIYRYTIKVLQNLDKKGLLPEMVQVGNETNFEILKHEPTKADDTINWKRNIGLLNRAIAGVRDATVNSAFSPLILLHIAQPENALIWFDKAFKNNIAPFDIIGLSYYSKWSVYSVAQLNTAISELKIKFGKEVMVVETAYPWTLKPFDTSDNILGEDALVVGYPASPQGQLKYMTDLTRAVVEGGGIGVIYWEPAWITSSCKTRWGTGSFWENAAFFDPDKNNDTLPVFKFFSGTLLYD
jgi:arabinogalactan endo-1,4-beta-galactosidase